jgi:hypothetical protein
MQNNDIWIHKRKLAQYLLVDFIARCFVDTVDGNILKTTTID